MPSRTYFSGLCGIIGCILFAAIAARADSLVLETSATGQGANDSILWSQLGADATTLGSSFTAKSAQGITGTVTLTGANSLTAVVCPASPCSWSATGLPGNDTLIWASNTGNGGNGPVTLSFGTAVSGAGVTIQANAPGQFTAQVQAFNGSTSLSSFTEKSDTNGDPIYIGVLDQTGANITKVVFSITSCGPLDSSGCTDFAIDTAELNSAGSGLAATTTTLASSLNPSTYGAKVTFTATVTSSGGTPSGTVTFKAGTTTLGTGSLSSGKATFATSSLSVANHSITGVYGGSGNFKGSTSPVLTETVKQPTSSTSLAPSLNPSTWGTYVTFTATVTSTGGTPTGTVSFKDATTLLATAPLSSGKATFTTKNLSVGTHSMTAIYGGSGNFVGSTSSVLAQTVKQATTSTSVTSSLNPSTSGQAVTFTATVASSGGTVTGTVTFKDGSTSLRTGSLNNGKVTFTTSTLSVGTHSITAVYGATTDFSGSTSSVLSQVVNP